MPGKRKPKALSLNVSPEALQQAETYRLTDEKFVSGDVEIDKKGGIKVQSEHKHEGVDFDALVREKVIGSGASSTVSLMKNEETGDRFAVKTISLFDKGMRHQLLSEVKALFASNCSALISFHGAFYGEGQVNIVLEFMNLGGLDNVKAKVPIIPENVLAGMTFQILWGESKI